MGDGMESNTEHDMEPEYEHEHGDWNMDMIWNRNMDMT